VNSVLYHYCPLDAFLAIIRDREIWLTNIFCMNDSAEHYWLRRVAQDVLRQKMKGNADLCSLASMLFPNEEDTDLYCCCLSEEGDSLGQWRAYADDGRGVAIGLSLDFLRKLSKKYQGLRLQRVVYERREQERIVEAIIEPLKGNCPSPAGGLPEEWTRDLPALVAKGGVWFDAARCKNPCFREEHEFRLIYDPSLATLAPMSQRRYRSRRDTLVPYYALPLSTDTGAPVIGEIVFGPKSAYKHNEREARKLLSENGYEDSRVVFRVSEATYR